MEKELVRSGAMSDNQSKTCQPKQSARSRAALANSHAWGPNKRKLVPDPLNRRSCPPTSRLCDPWARRSTMPRSSRAFD